MATIIDGKAIAAEFRQTIAQKVAAFRERFGRPPGLAVVLVGQNPASKVYVSVKQKACAAVGLHSERVDLPDTASMGDLLAVVAHLNKSPHIDGILVQLPLPAHLDAGEVVGAIDPTKDVDGFHPENVGKLWLGLPGLVPCTPAGVMELLRRAGTRLEGAEAVVIGRSHIVGKPMSALLLQAHATVTIAHSRTPDLATICRRADVLIAAVGRPGLVKGDWVKPGATVIDVGVNRLPDGRLVGDVDFASAEPVAGHITPVPGGVGPMTIAMLLHNTLVAASRREGEVWDA